MAKKETSKDSRPQSGAANEAAGGEPIASAGSKPAGAGEKRGFGVTSLLKHDGETFEPGDSVELTRPQFLNLKACGVVEGDWPED